MVETGSILPSQYQQAPVPPGGDLIKWHWFQFYDEHPPLLPNDQIIVSWDTAMSANELGDYSACVVLLARKEAVYVLDVFRERLEYPDLKRKVIDIHWQWRNACGKYALLIEYKGSGMSLVQDLKPNGIHAIPIRPVGEKIMRMHRHTARIEAGSVWLPSRATWLNDFRSEISAFPKGRYNDQVDALSQALDRAFVYRPNVPMWGSY